MEGAESSPFLMERRKVKMVKCEDCGRVFEAAELKEVQEYRGEYWGIPSFETMYYCPFCDGDAISDYKPKEMWVSFYLQDGTQNGQTIEADSIKDAERILREEYGENWGGIADWDFY